MSEHVHQGGVWKVNAIGNRDWTNVPDVGSLVWQRNGSGHVHGILLDEHPLASFERDELHREIKRTQGPASHHFGYGANGLLATHRWQNLDERGRSLERPRPWRAWEYDAAGQLTTLDDAWRDKKTYRYDALSRLTHVTAASGAEAFHYDPASNLLAFFYELVKRCLGGGALFVVCSVFYLCVCSALAIFLENPESANSVILLKGVKLDSYFLRCT